jgi:hypothetical protein
MTRNRNTTTRGESFDAATIRAVWAKGQIVYGYDPATWRKDACGAWMKFDRHGSTSDYGWEIDHIKPVAAGGSDDLWNLQPLYWQNNRYKSDNYPKWSCALKG